MSHPCSLSLYGGLALAFVAGVSAMPVAAAGKPNTSQDKPRAISVSSTFVRSFTKSGLDNARFGSLRFIGGLVLSSTDPAFGGLSGLDVSGDGRHLIAVSDAGSWLRARIDYRDGRPAGVSQAVMGPILALASRQLTRGRDRDAEAVRLYSGSFTSGIALIGFELNARIGFFRVENNLVKAPVRYLRPPMRLRHNRGIESVARIQAGHYKGSIVAFAERDRDGNGHHRGWLWSRKSSAKPGNKHAKFKVYPLAVRDDGGFALTDLAGSPNGDLFLLERRFRWTEGVKMRVRRIPGAHLKPGAVLIGKTLISADMGYQIDNMEGIAVHANKRGRLVLTLISDNNFNNFLQRTLLLQFEVAG